MHTCNWRHDGELVTFERHTEADGDGNGTDNDDAAIQVAVQQTNPSGSLESQLGEKEL